MKLIDIYRNYRRAYRRAKRRGWTRRRRAYDKFSKQNMHYDCIHWFDHLVPRLARALMEAAGAKAYKIGGPCGLCCEFTIELFDDPSQMDEALELRQSKWMLFRGDSPCETPENVRLSIVDLSVNTGEFKQGTIGAMNGMNHPGIKLDSGLTMKELLSLFEKQEEQVA